MSGPRVDDQVLVAQLRDDLLHGPFDGRAREQIPVAPAGVRRALCQDPIALELLLARVEAACEAARGLSDSEPRATRLHGQRVECGSALFEAFEHVPAAAVAVVDAPGRHHHHDRPVGEAPGESLRDLVHGIQHVRCLAGLRKDPVDAAAESLEVARRLDENAGSAAERDNRDPVVSVHAVHECRQPAAQIGRRTERGLAGVDQERDLAPGAGRFDAQDLARGVVLADLEIGCFEARHGRSVAIEYRDEHAALRGLGPRSRGAGEDERKRDAGVSQGKHPVPAV